ncbi:MAG: hypothetical protein MI757_10870 [Pirellulales bacterium]|nr:hypothetical protein [Pirellulales bacterium]
MTLPKLREIAVPEFLGGYAIWGATGRDDEGNIWFGVSSDHRDLPSARLFRYDLAADVVTDMGDAVGRLRTAGVHRDGESQMKIHSKIVQADDGYLYFASMDETGEKEKPLVYPTWGGHLWRMAAGSDEWEHLLTTKEALIAVSTTGRYVYALGYYNHVLYQFDTTTGKTNSVAVGSWGAHVSRNFLTDVNGHAYVPRVAENADGGSEVELVEYDEELNELQSVPLAHYTATPSFGSHGIVGFARFNNGSIIFTTDSGYLWLIEPSKDGPAKITEAGWLHPDGRSYPASLYVYNSDHICGLTRTKKHGYQWFVRSLKWNKTILVPFTGDAAELLKRRSLLLYGTNTRDDQGNAYFVGRYIKDGGKRPILLQVQIGR